MIGVASGRGLLLGEESRGGFPLGEGSRGGFLVGEESSDGLLVGEASRCGSTLGEESEGGLLVGEVPGGSLLIGFQVVEFSLRASEVFTVEAGVASVSGCWTVPVAGLPEGVDGCTGVTLSSTAQAQA